MQILTAAAAARMKQGGIWGFFNRFPGFRIASSGPHILSYSGKNGLL
jgi:hypothetical protein